MKTYEVRLTKIKSNHQNLRTDVIEGVTQELPVLGSSFRLIGESLTPGMDARFVHTTEIQFVEKMGNGYIFNTANSTYKLEVLNELEEEA